MNKKGFDQNVKIIKTHFFLFFKKIVTFTSTNKQKQHEERPCEWLLPSQGFFFLARLILKNPNSSVLA